MAIGSAQSLYRLRAQNDPDGERHDLNLIIGDRIELEITDGELEVAEVTGLKYGVYLEAGAQPAGPIESTPTTPDGAVQTNPGGGV